MTWIRLEADIFQDDDLIAAGADAAMVYIAILTMVKLYGSAGSIKASKLSGARIAHHLGNRNVYDVTRRYGEARTALEKVGLLIKSDDGRRFSVRNWAEYQRDPKNAARQKRYRDKLKPGVTSRNVSNAPTPTVVGVGGEGASVDAPAPSPHKKCRINFFRYYDVDTGITTWGPPPKQWSSSPGLRASMSGKGLRAPGAS